MVVCTVPVYRSYPPSIEGSLREDSVQELHQTLPTAYISMFYICNTIYTYQTHLWRLLLHFLATNATTWVG